MRELTLEETDAVSGSGFVLNVVASVVGAMVWDVIENGRNSFLGQQMQSYSNVVTPAAHAAGTRYLKRHGVYLTGC